MINDSQTRASCPPALKAQSPFPERSRSAADLRAVIDVSAVAAAMALCWLAYRPDPLRFAGFSVDRAGALLALLVTGIGAVCFRYSERCLDGHRRRGRFLGLLTGAVVSATAVLCASNLLLLFAAWASTSLFLHGLLTFSEERPECRRPARKKFLISRIGDVALLAAILLVARRWGTWDLGEFLRIAASQDPAEFRLPVLCIACAALAKSAQFPFHSWLPETMESPTPVSALMHAGIINAGGVLLLRFAPAVARVPEAWILLAAGGSLTMSLGLVSMWAQVKVKRTLAWSTVAQMGFMMVQCGLAVFPAALLHVVGHGCCKAWSFLRSGEVGAPAAAAPLAPWRSLGLTAVGAAAAVPAIAGASDLWGVSLGHPGELALAAMLAIAVGQVWSIVVGVGAKGLRPALVRIGVAGASGTALVFVAFGLYRGFAWFLPPASAGIEPPSGAAAWVAAVIPVTATLGLVVLHAALPVLHRWTWGRALQVHALHGFYLGAIADRLVDALTVRPSARSLGGQHA